jgi:hypothetical protein
MKRGWMKSHGNSKFPRDITIAYYGIIGSGYQPKSSKTVPSKKVNITQRTD